MNQTIRIALAAMLLVLGGCATSSALYYWGDYESLVHDMYVKPGRADPTTQILKLQELIQRAESLGRGVPPGVFAHLGMMHAMQGDAVSAHRAFSEEMMRFPESTTLIDGMLTRAGGSQR